MRGMLKLVRKSKIKESPKSKKPKKNLRNGRLNIEQQSRENHPRLRWIGRISMTLTGQLLTPIFYRQKPRKKGKGVGYTTRPWDSKSRVIFCRQSRWPKKKAQNKASAACSGAAAITGSGLTCYWTLPDLLVVTDKTTPSGEKVTCTVCTSLPTRLFLLSWSVLSMPLDTKAPNTRLLFSLTDTQV